MFSRLRGACLVCIVAAGIPAAAGAQVRTAPPTPQVEEAPALVQGWALLAQGQFRDAAAHAAQVLARNPRNAAALTLAVEAEIARGGAAAGVDQYERWLGSRKLEEPIVLRRLALAVLRQESRDKASMGRIDALGALAAEQDPAAVAELQAAASAGGAEARALASSGKEAGVTALIDQLRAGAATMTTIEALGRSGSRAAIQPIVERLADPRPEIRGAAAEALGRLGATSEMARLQGLLTDNLSFVRIRAAAALFRLGSDTGAAMLRELAASDSATSRLIAAQAMESRPDEAWKALVRTLTSATEAEVRIGAARLIAPHDPALAQSVLQAAGSDPNPAVREMAARAAAESPSSDLTALRQLLRQGDAPARVGAARRLVELTR